MVRISNNTVSFELIDLSCRFGSIIFDLMIKINLDDDHNQNVLEYYPQKIVLLAIQCLQF